MPNEINDGEIPQAPPLDPFIEERNRLAQEAINRWRELNARQVAEVRADRVAEQRFVQEFEAEFVQPRQPRDVFRVEPAFGRGLRALDDDTSKTDYKRGEELFQLILSGLREIYPLDFPCIIAGGAVRDVAAGCPEGTKDVDVYIPTSWEDFSRDSSQLGWQVEPHLLPKGKYDSKNCAVAFERRAKARVQGMVVDLMLMGKDKILTKADVDQFPVHAQRGIWTLEGGQEISPEMLNDITNKQFTIDPTITDKEKLKGVLAKIRGWQQRKAYKDWKIVEPDVKEWWAAKEEHAKAEEVKKEPSKKIQWRGRWFAMDENGNIRDAER